MNKVGVPFPLEVVVEVLHKMNWIKQKEEAVVICHRVRNSHSKLSAGNFSEEPDIGSVAISDCQVCLETNVVESKHDLFEMSVQDLPV